MARRKSNKRRSTKRSSTPNKRPKVGTAEWYAQYPWVVKKSVREPTAKDMKDVPNCHGKVCSIKCVDSGELRTINTQDAFQVKRTVKAQLTHSKQLRAERRKGKQAARKTA